MKSFRDYMKEKVSEYYRSSHVGKDFFTSPELDPVFGWALAESIYELIKDFKHPMLLELGGGNGSLAYDMLSYLKGNREDFYSRLTYHIYENSPYLRKIQRERLKAFESKVFWIQELIPTEGVIFSNEFFDCLPVHVIKEGKELYVEDDRTVWKDIGDTRIMEFIERMGYEHLEQTIEVCLDCIDLLIEVSKNLRRGYHILIDYGYTSKDIHKYTNGTLLGYGSHRVVKNIIKEGVFDLSAYVNFSALIEFGESLGFKTVSLQTQRDFLLSCPVFWEELKRLSLSEIPGDIERLSRLKTLLISMGDRFKVL
ncbi:MAG: SAM-dependent methyltransferase, partial [Aquificaceae bacterium]